MGKETSGEVSNRFQFHAVSSWWETTAGNVPSCQLGRLCRCLWGRALGNQPAVSAH